MSRGFGGACDVLGAEFPFSLEVNESSLHVTTADRTWPSVWHSCRWLSATFPEERSFRGLCQSLPVHRVCLMLHWPRLLQDQPAGGGARVHPAQEVRPLAPEKDLEVTGVGEDEAAASCCSFSL